MNSDKLKDHYSRIDADYKEIFAKDGIEDEVYLDDNETLRWRADPLVRWMADQMDLNDFWYPAHTDCESLKRDPVSKNDPHMRKMYRKMGYSLSGYWELFFWEVNNPIAEEWEGDDLA